MPTDPWSDRPAAPAGWEPGARPRRRSVLVAVLGTTLLSACGVRWEDVRLDDRPTPTPPRLSADDLARFAAVDTVRALQLLAETVALDPAAESARLAAQQHARQLEQLGPLPGPVPSPSSTPSGWPVPSTEATQTAAPVTTATLAEAESAAAASLVTAALGSGSAEVSGPLARLLSSLAASCAAHARLLGAAPPAVEVSAEPPVGPAPATADLLALVEAERAAAYAYGVLAVALSDGARTRGRAALSHHRRRSAMLAELAAGAGVEMPPAQPAYAVARPADQPEAVALAHQLELDVATAAGALVAASTGAWRAQAAHALVEATVAAAAWGPPPTFPGAPDLS